MEILSPAGNINLVNSAVNAKSNAVYGGFKLWNARNNATNFDKEEYNYIIDLLHKNNIKFYLTLNNLTLDRELKDIINYLSQPDIKLPDAFIVADIGLIKTLKDNFPDVPIHVSTQFGAHNISDIKFLEHLGVERVILAREVTYDELQEIKKNTTLEVEIFVWGSQCLSFSGLCFFGSLINGGTGNRGKCINLCRDCYSYNENEGTLLYVSDMNCINLVSQLTNIDSLKIEGRRRPPQEIENVIKEIKNKKTNGRPAGYLYGETVDKNNMIGTINQRIKTLYKANELAEINDYDVFVKKQNNEIVSFCDSSDPDAYYVYSELLSDYIIKKKNYAIDLTIVDNQITEASITNYKGENTVLTDNNKETIKISIHKLKEALLKECHDDINIIKIKCFKPKNGDINISKKLLDKMICYFKEQTPVTIEKNINQDFKGISKLYLQTDDLNIVDRFINENNIKIIYDINSVENLKNIQTLIDKYNDRIVYRLPIFNWKSEKLNKYYELLTNKEVMFTRYNQLLESKDITFKKKYTDYTVYSWNKESLKIVASYNIDEFTATPELSVKQNQNIFDNRKVQYIIAGRPALVYTRNCLRRALGCSKCNKDEINYKTIHNKSKNIDFIVSCKKDHREIYYQYPILNNYANFKIDGEYRFLAYGFTISEIEAFINNMEKPNYYEELITKETWKDSYECNLYEGRN